jgi:hypothetical protein
MSNRLAYRDSLVMAFGTGSRSHTIMRKECGRPIGRPVTAVAIDGSRYVIRRFECGYDSSAWRVALHTLGGSAPKDTLKMAALTVDLRMAAGEGEAGAAMIDFNLRAANSLGKQSIRHQQHRAAQKQKPGDNGPGKALFSCQASHRSRSCSRHCAATAGRIIF